MPPPDTIKEYEAIRLFVDRATAVLRTFRVTDRNGSAVVQVCYRLDGIPLAIELAAARVKVLSPEEIAARLDDRFRLLTGGSRAALPRHQTLQAAMDWSYDLLSDKEQTLLRRLSVFAGGFTLEAAEAICIDEGIESAEGQDGKTRYRLLETVRQYGRDRLLKRGEAVAICRRHLNWFLTLAEEFDAAQSMDREQWWDRLEREHDNLRAAPGESAMVGITAYRVVPRLQAGRCNWRRRSYSSRVHCLVRTLTAMLHGHHSMLWRLQSS